MKRPEFVARLLIAAGIFIAVGIPLLAWRATPLIHAQVAESGGWSPKVLQAQAGMPLQLRLTSDDVVHSFAVGQMDMESVDVMPGQVTELTLTFDKPGVYTFYCTRWCGLNHWRMRGTIEVSGGSSAQTEPAPQPLYVALGINPDTPHEAASIPSNRPSGLRGRELAEQLSINLPKEQYLSRSPFEVFQSIESTSLTEAQRWDVTASLWRANTSAEALEAGRKRFAQNCAACHGENGAGNGVFSDDLAAAGEASQHSMSGAEDMKMQTPVDFTDPKRMLAASPALLQGKILRGGMGTGMPMWGSIFTEDQVWELIAYLYSFQFDYPTQEMP